MRVLIILAVVVRVWLVLIIVVVGLLMLIILIWRRIWRRNVNNLWLLLVHYLGCVLTFLIGKAHLLVFVFSPQQLVFHLDHFSLVFLHHFLFPQQRKLLIPFFCPRYLLFVSQYFFVQASHDLFLIICLPINL